MNNTNPLASVSMSVARKEDDLSREPHRRNNRPESQVTLQQALRTLRGIRQRYEMERTAHPDTRSYGMHVALSDSDMVWIVATIEALDKPSAAGATEAAGPASQARPET
jgi:hypothetical protein